MKAKRRVLNIELLLERCKASSRDITGWYDMERLSVQCFLNVLRQDAQKVDGFREFVSCFEKETIDDLGLRFGRSNLENER